MKPRKSKTLPEWAGKGDNIGPTWTAYINHHCWTYMLRPVVVGELHRFTGTVRQGGAGSHRAGGRCVPYQRSDWQRDLPSASMAIAQ
jgi:hypothetical protein